LPLIRQAAERYEQAFRNSRRIMKNTTTLFLILISMTIFAQKKTEFEGEKVKVSFGDKVESEKMSIKFSQGTWNVTLFPLFEDNRIVENVFPKEAGIYSLTMNYSSELYYSEIVLYKITPNLEKLTFDFYQDCGRIFCRINSDYAPELNKEIVLNKLSEEIKGILKATEK
jgi:hypothetical protein